jgi:hypothetical protein
VRSSVVQLRFWLGMTQAQAAEVLGCSCGHGQEPGVADAGGAAGTGNV